MSNIPSNAVAQALAPITRASHEAARARQVQLQKTSHQSEEVEELDDTAVNSVGEESQGRHDRDAHKHPDDDEQPEEHLDLKSLPSPAPAPPPVQVNSSPVHLDISA